MKIHEYQAAQILKKAGIPIAEGKVASALDAAKKAAEEIGYPVVLKAQVPAGGRGKAGGITVVSDAKALEAQFTRIKGMKIKGYTIEKIYIVRALDIKKEFYMAVTIDPAKNSVVLIVSAAGGVEIEETARKNADQIHKFYLEGGGGTSGPGWKEFISAAFDDPSSQEQSARIFQALLNVFFQNDCSLAEINPLIIDKEGTWIAADAKITFDDNALFRHPEQENLRDLAHEDSDELEAKKADLSFVKMDGNVGCIVNGAGLAMATTDVIQLLGGRPANFLDVGGSSNPQKVFNALKIILKNKDVKVVLINIFGGITRCDDIAAGILEARKQLNFDVPLVVRLTGTNEKEGKDLLAQNHISTYASMREAVQRAVDLAS